MREREREVVAWWVASSMEIGGFQLEGMLFCYSLSFEEE
jgi:hypothetical protein